MEPEYIPLAQCRPRQLYLVEARAFRCRLFFDAETKRFLGQFAVAVFVGAGTPYFLGIRDKLVAFVDEEDHWDTGEPHGTVKPLREIPEVLPAEIKLDEHTDELFTWLCAQHEKYITAAYCCPDCKHPREPGKQAVAKQQENY
jgi:hypothetical protein